jgi:two-component system NtrC family sensor kinase
MNIITNAHQALLEVTGPRKLMIRSCEAGGWARVEIEDTGPGIPREILTRVFDPFFTTKEPGKGTGLGLSIVFGTVKAHDGRVSARSEPGGGAVFIVELPRARRVRAQRAGANMEMAPRPVPSRAILVVEDEEAVSSLMQEALAAEGHRVDAVPDGAEARRRLSRQDYDLIIADLRMPGEGGREFYEKVVSERPDMARRFVFATGDIASGEARAFFESTGRPCLEKPFDIATLQRVVRSLLETN